ncbi:MAG: AAA family ATPase [Planctomycetes bacterium]|nr:AAA family ATPase [Planctomycetota bacterium]
MTLDEDRLTESITLSQAKELIKCLAHQQSLLLLSPPGIGKSDIVAAAAAEAGLACRSLLGTQIAPEDVSGVPRIVGERSVFCPPRVLLPETPEPFCLFLDELPACTPDIQKAFYSLLLERRVGEHLLPAGTWVVAAGNRAEDRALVRTISSALVNRVILLQVRVDVSEWLAWAEANGVREDIRSFIRERNEALLRPVPREPVPFSTPRAWALLSRAVDLAAAAGILDRELCYALAAGRVSCEDADSYAAWCQINERAQEDVLRMPR